MGGNTRGAGPADEHPLAPSPCEPPAGARRVPQTPREGMAFVAPPSLPTGECQSPGHASAGSNVRGWNCIRLRDPRSIENRIA